MCRPVRAENRPLESGNVTPQPRHYSARTNNLLIRDIDQMRANLETKAEQVVDSRSAARFHAREPEPRPNVRGGHIPGSFNVPYDEMVDPKTKKFLPAEQLVEKFKAAGLDLRKPVVATCGSGVTAPILALGLYLIGHPETAVYDGSWAEWGAQTDTPIET